jgi:hypothetical protein
MWSAALSLAIAVGFLASIRQVNPVVKFRFSALTVIAALAAGIFTIGFFRVMLNRDNAVQNKSSQRRWFILFLLACIGALLGSLVIALKTVAPEKRIQFVIGLAIAICALSAVGFTVWKVVQFFEANDANNKRLQDESENRR